MSVLSSSIGAIFFPPLPPLLFLSLLGRESELCVFACVSSLAISTKHTGSLLRLISVVEVSLDFGVASVPNHNNP